GHLSIVQAEEVVLTRSHIGLVMEYVKGESLPRLLEGCAAAVARAALSGRGALRAAARVPAGTAAAAARFVCGNLVSYVTRRRDSAALRGGLCMDEDAACYFFRQLISAVQYCHEGHVAHRDLKLDNALLDDRDPPRLKLCDFGFAKGWATSSNMDTMRIGTAEYMGPELISGRSGYDGKKVDVWAAGVMLYVLLLGAFPFEMEDENYESTADINFLF
ncbi:hypothetical protein MNEG_13773, partial [Monoraphidium neglectum]